jgi:hypothetical protein
MHLIKERECRQATVFVLRQLTNPTHRHSRFLIFVYFTKRAPEIAPMPPPRSKSQQDFDAHFRP